MDSHEKDCNPLRHQLRRTTWTCACCKKELPDRAGVGINHGVVHDRATGQHVGMEAKPFHAERLLALLRELEVEALKAKILADPQDDPSAGSNVHHEDSAK